MDTIFLISGKKQHGKDTAANLIKIALFENYNDKYSLQNSELRQASFIIKHDCELYKNRLTNPHYSEEYIFGNQQAKHLIEEIVSILNSSALSKVNCFTYKFATKLKEIITLLTDCSLEDLEQDSFKNSHSKLSRMESPELKTQYYTYRQLLQKIGTDLFRDQLDPNIWVKSLIASIPPQQSKDKIILISDWRFKNEYEHLKELDFRFNLIPIRVVNPHIFSSGAEHPSETALDDFQHCKYILSNFGDLNDLYSQVKSMLQKEKIIAQTSNFTQK